jgi:para-aminobenzoate synthetase / 4-amino-4-deoxychorismate lyase
MPSMIHPARFDDLTPGSEHSFIFDDPVEVLIAREPHEVANVLNQIEDASRGGLWSAGFLSYEAAPAFDPALTVRPADHDEFDDLPLAWFGVYRTRSPITETQGYRADQYEIGPWSPTMSPQEYHQAVTSIRSRIEAGDTYQVNLSYRMRSDISGDLDAFYRDLITAQRGGYGALLRTGDFTVVSASPELFYRTEGRRLEVRPMKGTIGRGRWSAEDTSKREALIASAKDQAENLMIVDLLRNDVGRIAEFGTVAVPELFVPERYETVWQLTSAITAQLGEERGVAAVMSALFPSGSITGAPKASTMGIIAELETTRRGVYCGAIGFVAPDGTNHFNVAIRTVVIDTRTNRAQYGTGGGITWDSTADAEFAEARLKADVLTIKRPEFDLIETMRWDGDGYLFLDEHLERLGASASYFGFGFDSDAVRAAVNTPTLDPGRQLRVRCTLHRDGTVDLTETGELTEGFIARPDDPGFAASTVRLAVGAVAVDATDPMLFHKTTWRDRYDTAMAAAPDGIDDVVLLNTRSQVTETTIANIAVLVGERWVTPPLDSGCLPGVFRSSLLKAGVLVEAPIELTDLRQAAAVAVINSVRGWRRGVINEWE